MRQRFALLLLVGLFACGAPKPAAGPVPDFSLPDLNPASPRSGQQVSPGDYLGTVSVWYFTHAT